MDIDATPDSHPFTQVLLGLVARIDDVLGRRGWDQQPVAFDLIPADTGGGGFEVNLVPVTLDQPSVLESLIGRSAPAEAIGVVVALEGWTFPDGTPPAGTTTAPSEHPERVEIRHTMLQLRDGTLVTAIRRRDRPQPEVFGAGSINGKFGAVLRRYAGAANPPAPLTPRQVGVLLVVAALTETAAHLDDNPDSGFDVDDVVERFCRIGPAAVFAQMHETIGVTGMFGCDPFAATVSWDDIRRAAADDGGANRDNMLWCDEQLFYQGMAGAIPDLSDSLFRLGQLVTAETLDTLLATLDAEGIGMNLLTDD